MKTVLVSGAGGYIGIPLCHELLRRGHKVIGFDRYFFGRELMFRFSAHANMTSVVGDTRSITPQHLDGVDVVVDLAGLSNDASADINAGLTERINVLGAKNLIDCAVKAGVTRYVYSSSASVYGHGYDMNLTEEAGYINPLTTYAESKVAIECKLHDLTEMETVVLRNATVFGVAPRMRFDLVINIMTLRAWAEKVIYIMGGGEQWRPLIHVEDLARIFGEAVDAPSQAVDGQIINVGAWNYRIRDLAQIVSMMTPAAIHQIPDEPDKRSYHLSFEKMGRIFGKQEFTSPETAVGDILSGLKAGTLRDAPNTRTLQWYKSIMEWDRRLRELNLDGRVL